MAGSDKLERQRKLLAERLKQQEDIKKQQASQQKTQQQPTTLLQAAKPLMGNKDFLNSFGSGEEAQEQQRKEIVAKNVQNPMSTANGMFAKTTMGDAIPQKNKKENININGKVYEKELWNKTQLDKDLIDISTINNKYYSKKKKDIDENRYKNNATLFVEGISGKELSPYNDDIYIRQLRTERERQAGKNIASIFSNGGFIVNLDKFDEFVTNGQINNDNINLWTNNNAFTPHQKEIFKKRFQTKIEEKINKIISDIEIFKKSVKDNPNIPKANKNAIIHELNNAKEQLDAADGGNVIYDWLKGVGNHISDIDFWTLGITEFARNKKIQNASEEFNTNYNKYIKQGLSEEEANARAYQDLPDKFKAMFDAYATAIDVNQLTSNLISNAYKGGQMAADIIPLAVTMGAGSGVNVLIRSFFKGLKAAKTGSKIAGTIGKGLEIASKDGKIVKSLEKSQKAVQEAAELSKMPIGKQIFKDYGKTLARGVEDAVTTTLISPKTYADLSLAKANANFSHEDFTIKDYIKSFGQSFIDNVTETSTGAFFSPATRYFNHLLKIKPNSALSKIFGGNNNMNKYFHLGGALEEISEEYAGAGLNVLLGYGLDDDDLKNSFKEFLSKDSQAVLFASILPATMIMGVIPNTLQYIHDSRSAKAYRNIKATLNNTLNQLGIDNGRITQAIEIAIASGQLENVTGKQKLFEATDTVMQFVPQEKRQEVEGLLTNYFTAASKLNEDFKGFSKEFNSWDEAKKTAYINDLVETAQRQAENTIMYQQAKNGHYVTLNDENGQKQNYIVQVSSKDGNLGFVTNIRHKTEEDKDGNVIDGEKIYEIVDEMGRTHQMTQEQILEANKGGENEGNLEKIFSFNNINEIYDYLYNQSEGNDQLRTEIQMRQLLNDFVRDNGDEKTLNAGTLKDGREVYFADADANSQTAVALVQNDNGQYEKQQINLSDIQEAKTTNVEDVINNANNIFTAVQKSVMPNITAINNADMVQQIAEQTLTGQQAQQPTTATQTQGNGAQETVVGRSMTKDEADNFIPSMEQQAMKVQEKTNNSTNNSTNAAFEVGQTYSIGEIGNLQEGDKIELNNAEKYNSDMQGHELNVEQVNNGNIVVSYSPDESDPDVPRRTTKLIKNNRFLQGATFTYKSGEVRQQQSAQETEQTNETEKAELQQKMQEWLSDENINWAEGKSLNEIIDKFGNKLEPIAIIPQKIREIFPSLTTNYLYSGKGYFIDHAINHHPELSKEEYNKIQTILNEYDDIKDLSTSDDKTNKVAVIKKFNNGYAIVIELSKEDNKIVLHKTLFYNSKSKRLPFETKRSLLYKSSADGRSTINPTENSSRQTPKISALDDFSSGKDTTISSIEQTKVEKTLNERIKSGEVMSNTPEQTLQELSDELDNNEEDIANVISSKIGELKNKISKTNKPKTSDIAKIKASKQKINHLQQQLDYWQKVQQQANKPTEQQSADETPTPQTTEEQQQSLNTLKTKFDSKKVKIGNKASKILPNGKKIRGRYILVEAGGVTPSHNPQKGFAQSEDFPRREDGKTINDRDYQNDKTAQAQVREKANNYDGRAVQDVPIIDENGVVLSGNDRTMSGELAAKQGTDEKYIESLTENAATFGFTEEDVQSVKHPRVVFVVDEAMPYTTETFAVFNKDEKKTQNDTHKAVKIGKVIKDKTLQRIAQIIDKYDSIAQVWEKKENVSDILKALVDDGLLTTNEVEQYVREDGLLSDTGKSFIETVLLGSVLKEDTILKIGNEVGLKAKIVSALAQLIKNRSLSQDYSLIDEINEAVLTIYDARKTMGIKYGDSLKAYYTQLGLFGDSNIKSKTIMMLADILNANKIKELKNVLTSYNETAQSSANGELDMFSQAVQSKEEILDNILNQLGYGERNKQIDAISNSKESSRDNGTEPRNEQQGSDRRSQKTTVARGEQRGEIKNTFLDVVKTLYEKGKEFASNLYKQSFFDVADTPEFMKDLGLKGDRFTIKYGVIARHFGKDEAHNLSEDVWKQLPQAIQKPFAITEYFNSIEDKNNGKIKGYRLYTTIKVDNGFVVVGVDVKNAGKGIEVNSISTIFNREKGITENENEIYRSEKITPEQEALLRKPNSSQYQPAQELSGGKDTKTSETDKENSQEKSDTKQLKEQKVSDMGNARAMANEQEQALMNELEGILTNAGIEVISDNEEAQRILDRANGKVKEQVFGGNSGYVGYSKSKRAVDAEERGLRNSSQMDSSFKDEVNTILKENGFDKKVTLKEIKDNLKKITPDEWHHTSKFGNKTNYYSAENIAEYFSNSSQYNENVKKREELENRKSAIRKQLTDEAEKVLPTEEITVKAGDFETKVNVFKSSNGLYLPVSRGMFGRLNEPINISLSTQIYAAGSLKNEAERGSYYVNSDWIFENKEKVETALKERQQAMKDALNKALETNPNLTEELKKLNNIEGNIKFHRVYHGSGADFNAFDSNFMSTGEGAQAYGYGHYVTEVEGIGRAYAESTRKLSVTFSDVFNYDKINKDLIKLSEKYKKKSVADRKELISKAEFFAKKWDFVVPIISLPYQDFLRGSLSKNDYIVVADILDYIKNDIPQKTLTNLYTVEIPDDNGSNYLQFERPVTKKLRDKVKKNLIAELTKEGADYEGVEKELMKELEPIFAEDVDGNNLYGSISLYLGGDQETSEFFAKMGIVGISYPANYTTGGRKDKSRNFVVFKDSDLKITDKVKFFKTSAGEVYGFTIGGKIYIDKSIATAETLIHEYTHLWAAALRKKDAKHWEKIINLMKGTEQWEQVKKTYKDLQTDDEIADEVLAHYSGKRGAERLREERKQATQKAKDDNAKVKAVISVTKIRAALKMFWQKVTDFFGGKFSSAEKVADMTLADLMKGVNPNKKLDGKENIRFQNEDAIAKRDKEYLAAVERGDMETAQRMVDEAARQSGYDVDSSYQGTSAFNGTAPSDEGYYATKEERVNALKGDDFEGSVTLGDLIDVPQGFVTGGIKKLAESNLRSGSKLTKGSAKAILDAINSGKRTVTIYRSVPADTVKENSVRNGDWVTLNKDYALDNADIHNWKGKVIQQEVDINNLWWDGNDLNEWGYDDGKGYVYKNTENNRKLNDAVTYDDNGNVIPLSKRFNQEKSDIRYQFIGNLEQVNQRFNEELQQQIDGTLPKGHIYQLGMPSEILRSAGFPNKPIELSSTRLLEKATQSNHEFEISDLKGLPEALAKPIAVFRYGDKAKAENVIIAIEKDGKQFVVGVHFNQNRRGLEVNDIRGLFPKDNAEWLNWITQGKAEFLDKEKIQDLINKRRTNLAEVEYLDLNSVAKILQNFENPTISQKENAQNGKEILYHIGDKIDEKSTEQRRERHKVLSKEAEKTQETAEKTINVAHESIIEKMFDKSGIEYEMLSSEELLDKAEEFDSNIKQVLATNGGVVYGFTVGGKIYLDRNLAGARTKIHEYTHLWDKFCQKNNPEMWKQGVELMKQTQLWQHIKDTGFYDDLSEDDLASEIHARLVGKEGDNFLREMQQKAMEYGDNDTVWKRLNVISKLKDWLRGFWKWVKGEQLGEKRAKEMNIDDFINMPIMDLMKGTDIKIKSGANERVQEERQQNTKDEQEIIDKAKANGTYMKAPNGKPTKLSAKQWVQVRTKAFKEWFGDWEISPMKDFLLHSTPVSDLKGNEFEKDGIKLTDKVPAYYNEKCGGKVERAGIGEILLDKDSVKDSISHGIGRVKSSAFAAVPDIIKEGIIIDTATNWKDRGYNSVTISAPITIAKERYIGVAVVKRFKNNKNRFYLHEVVLQKNLLDDSIKTDTKADYHQGDIAKLLQKIVTTKENFSKVVDENGEPLVVYHGTNAEFNTFDVKKAGLNTGNLGLFGKGFYVTDNRKLADNYNRKNGRLAKDGSGRTMELFVSLKNPFVWNDKKSIAVAIKLGFPESRINRRGNLTELLPIVNNADIEAFTEKLIVAGYDGVIFSYQEGVREIIAFSPNQIKSATDNVGTFDTANDDIRYEVQSNDPYSVLQAEIQAEDDYEEDLNNRFENFSRKEKKHAKAGEVFNAGDIAKGEQDGKQILPKRKKGITGKGTIVTNSVFQKAVLRYGGGWQWDEQKKKFVKKKNLLRGVDNFFDRFAPVRRMVTMCKLLGIDVINNPYYALVDADNVAKGLADVRIQPRVIQHYTAIQDIMKATGLTYDEVNNLLTIRSIPERTAKLIAREFDRIEKRVLLLSGETLSKLDGMEAEQIIDDLVATGKTDINKGLSETEGEFAKNFLLCMEDINENELEDFVSQVQERIIGGKENSDEQEKWIRKSCARLTQRYSMFRDKKREKTLLLL